MNRKITNTIRFLLDECLPPVIRDNKYFMYLPFYIWFKGKKIKDVMNFKSNVWTMSKEEFGIFYNERISLAKDRPTDLSEISIDYMIKFLNKKFCENLLDVGCGNGYWLGKVVKNVPIRSTAGCDVFDMVSFKHSDYQKGDIENLPFEDNSFDVVTCHHVLEHVINLQQSINELKRVCRKFLIVVVPCQRYYYYTLDEHINFFPYREYLEYVLQMDEFSCENIKGDFLYIGIKKKRVRPEQPCHQG